MKIIPSVIILSLLLFPTLSYGQVAQDAVKTEIFTLHHMRARDIEKSVRAILTPENGHVLVNEDFNSLVVTDTQAKIRDVRALINVKDREKEIALETKVLQIMLNDEHPMGVDWEAIVSNFQSLDFFPPPSKPVTTKGRKFSLRYFAQLFKGKGNQSSIEYDGKLSLGSISEEDYVVLLEALDTVGVINVISNVKTTTAGSRTSEITINSQDTFLISKEGEDEDEGRRNESVRFYLSPRAEEDGLINVEIKPNSNMDKSAIIKVKDGSTIIVGGLFKEVIVERTRKIPLLGDLPFLGFAFRNQGEDIRKTEIVIFLTPRGISE